jgi:hypothetical protein
VEAHSATADFAGWMLIMIRWSDFYARERDKRWSCNETVNQRRLDELEQGTKGEEGKRGRGAKRT